MSRRNSKRKSRRYAHTLAAAYDILIEDQDDSRALVLGVKNQNIIESYSVQHVKAPSGPFISSRPHLVPAARADKAFRMHGLVSVGRGKVVKWQHVDISTIPNFIAIADQGSEINLVTTGIVKLLNMPIYQIPEAARAGMGIRTANSDFDKLSEFVYFKYKINGV